MDTILELLFNKNLLIIVAVASAFCAAALLVYILMPDEKLSAAKKMLDVVDDSAREHKIFMLKMLHPLLMLVGSYYRHSKSERLNKYKESRQQLITAAGLRKEITPEEFIGFKWVMAFVFPLMGQYIGMTLGMPVGFSGTVLLTVVGGFAPDLWLYELVKKRKRAIFRSLPYTIDLLTLSVEAGLDFIAAIKRVTERSRENPLVDELKILLNEINLGTTRTDALRNLANRVRMEELNSFTTLLIQADQLGASIGPVLRAQSDSMRSTRFQRAEVAGGRATQLVLFPMIFCIFPAIFIIILGPFIVRYLAYGFTGLL